MRPFPIANLWITCGLFCVFPVDWVHLLLCSKSFCFGGENSETALVECLKDGTLFQAGLDVFEHEPIQESSRELFNLDNVIMTPHMAATTEQSVLNCCTSVANDIVAVCNGQEPKVKAQKPKF